MKNFQLVAWDHNTDCTGGDVLLQFGKLGAETFALDFAYPLTAELALAIGEWCAGAADGRECAVRSTQPVDALFRCSFLMHQSC